MHDHSLMEYKSIQELGPIKELKRTPKRPLGPLSDFVVEELPALVAEKDSRRLNEAAEDMCNGVRLEPNSTAHLDLMMLTTAIEVLGATAGPQLQTAIQGMEQPANITYEDVIIGQPHDTDPRTFLPGKTAEAERFFYRTHRSIEDQMAKVVAALEMGLLHPDKMRDLLETVALPEMKGVNAQMEGMQSDLDGHQFMKFRGFFTPRGQVPGASGKYSAGSLAIDTLVAGNNLKLKPKLDGKRSELLFYPRTNIDRDGVSGQSDILRSFGMAETGRTLLELDLPGIEDGRRELIREISRFRTSHFRLVGKFLKDVMIGTAGESIAPFLRGFSLPFQKLKKALQ